MLAVLLVTFASAAARVFTPCEFAAELLKPEHKVDFWQIPTWVCLAHHATGLDTRYHTNSRHYFGIFRFSSHWCSRCGYDCSDLANDDVSKDIDCAVNIVYKEHEGSQNGFYGWGDWYTEYCSEPWRNLKDFDCKVDTIGFGIPSPSIPKSKSSSPSSSSTSEVLNTTNSNPGYMSSQSSFFWSDFLSIALLCSAYILIITVVIFLYRSNVYTRITEH